MSFNSKSLIKNLPAFRNKFFVMRHGNSEANASKLISSSPTVATVKHGLTELGVGQATRSAEAFTGNLTPSDKDQGVVVVSSDFTRARQTAEILLSTFVSAGVPTPEEGVELNVSLRERFFGELDGGPDTEYGSVWEHDASDADHTEYGSESVNSVILRTTKLVKNLDEKHKGKAIFLVAHGDVLQILQTAVEKLDPRGHRSLAHLDTACIRELVLPASTE